MALKRILEWLFFGLVLVIVAPVIPWSISGLAILGIVCFFLLPGSE